jgi:hypothetical protein
MNDLFLIMAMSLPSPHFTHPPLQCATAIDYERAKLEKFIHSYAPEAEVFIHENPQVDKLIDAGFERVPFTHRGAQIWIRRKEVSDKRIKASA